MSIMSVRLSDTVQSRWAALCAERGVNPSTAVREFIEKEVQANNVSTPARAGSTHEPTSIQKKVRVPIWLTQSERENIRLRAQLQGSTRAGWIIQAIRAALAGEPGLSDKERRAVEKSNEVLLKIEQNLDKITRRFEALPASHKPPSLKGVEQLISDIDTHTSKVDQLVRSATERWLIG